MKDGKFKSLVVDTYKKYKESDTLFGVLYSAISTYGFSEILDIEEFAQTSGADMLHLQSGNVNIDIYEFDLLDYRIESEKNVINIKLRNKEVTISY